MGMVFLAILLTVYTDPIKGASNLHNPLNLTWQLISLQGREVLAQLSKMVPLVLGSQSYYRPLPVVSLGSRFILVYSHVLLCLRFADH